MKSLRPPPAAACESAKTAKSTIPCFASCRDSCLAIPARWILTSDPSKKNLAKGAGGELSHGQRSLQQSARWQAGVGGKSAARNKRNSLPRRLSPQNSSFHGQIGESRGWRTLPRDGPRRRHLSIGLAGREM